MRGLEVKEENIVSQVLGNEVEVDGHKIRTIKFEEDFEKEGIIVTIY